MRIPSKGGPSMVSFLIPKPQWELKIYGCVHKQVEQIQDQDWVVGKRDLVTLMVGTTGQAAQHVNLPVPEGCTDPRAANFDPTARSDNGTCLYDFKEEKQASDFFPFYAYLLYKQK